LASAENDFNPTLKELPIRLYFQDEGRFGRINTVQRCWCKKGILPAVTQQMVREYTYAFSAVCPETGNIYSLIMPRADSEAMSIFLEELSEDHNDERIILCMDKAGWHTTKQLKVPDNLIVWFLPPYSPELNPVELIWRELRAKYFNNKTFKSLNAVDDHLEFALIDIAKDKDAIKKLTKINYLY
jgi:transposase